MSKYDPLWKHVTESEGSELVMMYSQTEDVLGFPVDHSFLTYKKELVSFGWQVKKISMKEQDILFERL